MTGGVAPRRIERYIAELRKVAEPVGPMHAYWDIIFDLEAVLRGEMRGPAAVAAVDLADRTLEERKQA